MADPALLGSDLRQGVSDLTALASAELRSVWQSVGDDPEAAQRVLMEVAPDLVEVYGAAAATLAADWYDEQRDRAGIEGPFRAIPATLPESGALALVGWAVQTGTSAATRQALFDGGMQRRVAAFSRQTVMQSSVADPRSLGWQRAGAGNCKTGFCDMLIARGTVYYEKTVDFAAHDNCKCVAVQVWTGQVRPVQPFRPSLRHVSDADKARLRDYLRAYVD